MTARAIHVDDYTSRELREMVKDPEMARQLAPDLVEKIARQDVTIRRLFADLLRLAAIPEVT